MLAPPEYEAYGVAAGSKGAAVWHQRYSKEAGGQNQTLQLYIEKLQQLGFQIDFRYSIQLQ